MNYHLSKRFLNEAKAVALYISENFGKQYAREFSANLQQDVLHITQYPEASAPEPLLRGKQIVYRSKIVSKHNKAIYYIKGDTIYFVDLWDMRRHPDNLSKRIKSK